MARRDALSQAVRDLQAERYQRSDWWSSIKPDTDVAVARRRLVVARALGLRADAALLEEDTHAKPQTEHSTKDRADTPPEHR